MRTISALVDGYRSFLAEHYTLEADTYLKLASGQSPRTMIIACCDSRVDPSRIFSAGPGQLFIVRNVANLVPPFEPHGDYHGTSAALEFAVAGLNVADIVILGHARCGGVNAFLQSRLRQVEKESFIAKWMSLMKPAFGEVMRSGVARNETELQAALELASIRNSIDNLQSFPFVKKRVGAGTLSLHGGHFDILTGHLKALDPVSREFIRIE